MLFGHSRLDLQVLLVLFSAWLFGHLKLLVLKCLKRFVCNDDVLLLCIELCSSVRVGLLLPSNASFSILFTSILPIARQFNGLTAQLVIINEIFSTSSYFEKLLQIGPIVRLRRKFDRCQALVAVVFLED